MSDVTVKKISDVSYYQGPQAIPGIKFRTAAKELGVTAWGMSVLELDAGCEKYPEHHHKENGQEEVYVVLDGGGTLVADGKSTPVERGMLVRVPPEVTRKFLAGPGGIVLLAIGAKPGEAYKPR